MRRSADRLDVVKIENALLDQLILRVPVGVVWLSGREQVMKTTPEAFKIAEDTHAYQLGERLHWRASYDSERLEQCWNGPAGVQNWFVATTEPCTVLTVGVRRTAYSPLPGVMQQVGIVTLWRRPVDAVPVRVLRDLFGLTPAESRLADALFDSLTVSGAARRCDIALGTARTYLKRILAKTGTTSQSELISLLSLLAVATFASRSAAR